MSKVQLVSEYSDDNDDGGETTPMLDSSKGNFKCVINKNEQYKKKMDESW